MTNLLHLDTSARRDGSISRQVSASFAEEWRAANPGGEYIYRDLGTSPLPHLDEAAMSAAFVPEEYRTQAHRDALAVTGELIAELKAADTVLIASAMYNFTITSTLKSWIDRIVAPEFMTPDSVLHGKQVVVVTARGGSYAAGTPRENFDFQEPYLRAVLGEIGLGDRLTFVHAELTLADVNPKLAEFRELAVTSLKQAHETAKELAVAA